MPTQLKVGEKSRFTWLYSFREEAIMPIKRTGQRQVAKSSHTKESGKTTSKSRIREELAVLVAAEMLGSLRMRTPSAQRKAA